jgi:hypothetical protein
MWLIVGLSLGCNLSAQVEPNAGQWKTWVITSGSALRVPPPPDANGTAAEIQSVKKCVASRNSAALAQIHFWDAGAPGYRWMQITEQLAVSEGLGTPLQTRALALVAAAIYDSMGEAAIAHLKADGSSQLFSGSFPGGIGVWGSPKPVAPQAGNWHPWLLIYAARCLNWPDVGRPGRPAGRREGARRRRELNVFRDFRALV